jgi:hypothetical protein
MPTKSRREDRLITLFLSAYEDDTWTGAIIDWVDQRQNRAVEAVATRSDGRTLAIEHTLIQLFSGERTDFERFKPFLRIESDQSLSVPGRIIYVNVPRGALDGLKPREQDRIVNACHDWLRSNIRSFPSGDSMQTCHISPCGGAPAVLLQLKVQVIDDTDFEGGPPP